MQAVNRARGPRPLQQSFGIVDCPFHDCAGNGRLLRANWAHPFEAVRHGQQFVMQFLRPRFPHRFVGGTPLESFSNDLGLFGREDPGKNALKALAISPFDFAGVYVEATLGVEGFKDADAGKFREIASRDPQVDPDKPPLLTRRHSRHLLFSLRPHDYSRGLATA
jgi:hypothetical protein